MGEKFDEVLSSFFGGKVTKSLTDRVIEKVWRERVAKYYLPRPCDVFWSSEVGECRRKIFYERLALKRKKRMETEQLAKILASQHQMFLGELIHAGIERMVVESLLAEQEARVVWTEHECSYELPVAATIKGRADIVWMDQDGRLVVEEIKTKGKISYTLAKEGAYDTHIAQVISYLEMLGAKKGYIIYFPISQASLAPILMERASSKIYSDSEEEKIKGSLRQSLISAFPVDPNEKKWKEIVQKLTDVFSCLVYWELPPRDKDPLSDKVCDFCPFREACLRDYLPPQKDVRIFTEAELAEIRAEEEIKELMRNYAVLRSVSVESAP